jgi:hypothetical protein
VGRGKWHGLMSGDERCVSHELPLQVDVLVVVICCMDACDPCQSSSPIAHVLEVY